MKVWMIRVALCAVALILGALQENWKIDINYILDLHVHVNGYDALSVEEKVSALKSNHAYMPYDYYFNHQNNAWIVALSIAQIKKLKWALTVFFVVSFCVINYLILRTFTTSRTYRKWFVGAYIGLFALSFLIFAMGRLFGQEQVTYAVSREIVGGLQSLVPLMIVLPFIVLQSKLNSTQTT